ncbi:MAG TPA: response regulator [Terriglobia bacterium]|nr:response regulator [Terriglobia bacterium]
MQQRVLRQQMNEEFLLAPRSRVLLVDEDDADREYYAGVLEAQGHEVTSCDLHQKGAELAESGDFDFVITSQGGPAFEGKVVLERLRKRRNESRLSGPTPWDIPVLVAASSADMPSYLEAMQLGAVDYVEKPIHPRDLRRFLRSHQRPLRFAARSGPAV